MGHERSKIVVIIPRVFIKNLPICRSPDHYAVPLLVEIADESARRDLIAELTKVSQLNALVWRKHVFKSK
jgi:hypothetical protein